MVGSREQGWSLEATGTSSEAQRSCDGRGLVLPDPEAVKLGMANSWLGWFSEMIGGWSGATKVVKEGGAAATEEGGGTREVGLVFDWFFFILGGRFAARGGMEGCCSVDVFPERAKTMVFSGGTVEGDGRAFEWICWGKDGRSRSGRWVWWSPAGEGGMEGGRSSSPPSGEAIMAGQRLVNGKSTLVKVA